MKLWQASEARVVELERKLLETKGIGRVTPLTLPPPQQRSSGWNNVSYSNRDGLSSRHQLGNTLLTKTALPPPPNFEEEWAVQKAIFEKSKQHYEEVTKELGRIRHTLQEVRTREDEILQTLDSKMEEWKRALHDME